MTRARYHGKNSALTCGNSGDFLRMLTTEHPDRLVIVLAAERETNASPNENVNKSEAI
jgi:hypothetical protein